MNWSGVPVDEVPLFVVTVTSTVPGVPDGETAVIWVSLSMRKLAADVERNRRLLDHITDLPSDWPVLLFAVSVDHAHAMAALLGRSGVSAAAISANTDKGARRHYVERFRNGEIRVLANFNVLAAGFDADDLLGLELFLEPPDLHLDGSRMQSTSLFASPLLAASCIASGIDVEPRHRERPSDHAPVWAEFRRETGAGAPGAAVGTQSG